MGDEIAQAREWNHDQSLDWHLLAEAEHLGIQRLLRDLNRLYTVTPALHEIDFSDAGFEWIDYNDRDSSVLSWLRRDSSGRFIICVANLTPTIRESYRIGVPDRGTYRTLLSTDDLRYEGSGVGAGSCDADENGTQGRPYSINLTLPPLATVFLGKD
jgi:1,4-alpha-glucan branching enzyme